MTLRGNVADPERFPWKSGMRLSDVIPDKESLLTRDYWLGRNALGAAEQPDRVRGFGNDHSERLARINGRRWRT